MTIARHNPGEIRRLRRRQPRVAGALLLALALTGCHGHKDRPTYATAAPPPAPPTASYPSRRAAPAPVERVPAAPAPEEARGKPVFTEVGIASWYGPPYKGRKAADGTVFDENALTAAHRTLPMGSIVRVTNLATNQSVLVKITDRGPFVEGRTLDLSLAAAKAIGVYRTGVAKVRVEAFAHPAADPAGRWCVQIGVFIDPADAIQLKNDLIHRYTSAKVIEFAGPTGHWVRITTAAADKTTATRIADSIHLPDAQPYLIRLN
jgi:rare lipoprotein A